MGKLVKTSGKGSRYSNQDRRRAVVEFYVHGNMIKVSEITGIPDTTLATWKNKSPWWGEMVAEVRDEISEEILVLNLSNATKSGKELTDRIENGDQKLVKVKRAIKHKNGDVEMSEDYELRTEPMKGRDLAVAGGIVQDKAARGMGLPTHIVGKAVTSEDLLNKFAAIAREYNRRVVSEQKDSSVQEENNE